MSAGYFRPTNACERECNEMATDSVVEFIIKRNKGRKSVLATVGIAAAAVAVVGGVFLLAYFAGGQYMGLAFLGSVIAAGIAVYLIRRLNLEFEYSFFSGELTIDRIFNQTSRASLAEFPLRQVEVMGRYDPATFKGNDTVIICTADEDGRDGIYLKVPNNVVTLGKSMNLQGSNIVFVLENGDRVHESIKSGLRASVYREGMKSFN